MSQMLVLALLVMFLAVALVGIVLLAVSGPESTAADRDLGDAAEPVAEPTTTPEPDQIEIRPA